MIELEKTKRISIATTLFILIVLIAILAYKRPKHLYTVNTADTLEKLISQDYLISLNDIVNPSNVIIDIRSQFEFEKGSLEGAINIYTPDILQDENIAVFEELKEQNKTAILYGENPSEVNAPFMLLYQLGFDNVKILTIENSYVQNKLISENIEIEKSEADIKEFIAASLIKAAKNAEQKIKAPKKIQKKVITIKKKKKAPAEGGC